MITKQHFNYDNFCNDRGGLKIIVAGSRIITDYELIRTSICESGFLRCNGIIVSGGANGVDKLGEEFAKKNNLTLVIFKANWSTLGKKAGILRNIEMEKYADCLVAIWNGKSVGTKHMINYMKNKNKPVYLVTIEDVENE